MQVGHWDRENCPLYGVAGCPLFRGCLSIEVNGRAVRTFIIVRYIVGVRYSGVSVKRGSTVVWRPVQAGSQFAPTNSLHFWALLPHSFLFMYTLHWCKDCIYRARGCPEFAQISIDGPIRRCWRRGCLQARPGKFAICTDP